MEARSENLTIKTFSKGGAAVTPLHFIQDYIARLRFETKKGPRTQPFIFRWCDSPILTFYIYLSFGRNSIPAEKAFPTTSPIRLYWLAAGSKAIGSTFFRSTSPFSVRHSSSAIIPIISPINITCCPNSTVLMHLHSRANGNSSIIGLWSVSISSMKMTSVTAISLLKVARKRTMTSSSGQPVTYLVQEKTGISHLNCLCVIQMSVANTI